MVRLRNRSKQKRKLNLLTVRQSRLSTIGIDVVNQQQYLCLSSSLNFGKHAYLLCFSIRSQKMCNCRHVMNKQHKTAKCWEGCETFGSKLFILATSQIYNRTTEKINEEKFGQENLKVFGTNPSNNIVTERETTTAGCRQF